MKLNILSNATFCLLVLFILGIVSVLPAVAMPADTDGDYVITEQELSNATDAYMKSNYLHIGSNAPNAEELSLAANNCLKLPYGRIVIPVDGTENLVPTPNALTIKASQETLLYEGLVTRQRDGTFRGWLAETDEWMVSDDGKTWTFYLVNDATWQDGEPFTSADVKFTFDYLTDPDNNLKMGSVFSDVLSVDCPSEYTAVFHLKTTQPMFLDTLSGGPGIAVFPKHIWESCDVPSTEVDALFIGTGPFRFLNKEGTSSVVEAYSNYHGALPLTKQVIKTVMSDESLQVEALKNGDIDLMGTGFGITSSSASALKGKANITVFSTPYNGNVYEVAFNSAKYPTNLTAFRKALSHAVNRESMTGLVGSGYGHVTNTAYLLPPNNPVINTDTNNRFDYNISLAKELLNESGFTLNTSGGGNVLYDPSGNPVSLSTVYGGKAHEGSVDEKIFLVLTQDWETELGIDLTTPEEQSDKTLYVQAINNTNVHFDGMPMRFHNDIDDLDNFQYSPLDTDYYHWHNVTFDDLIDDLGKTANAAQRKTIGDQLQEILVQQAPMIPVCSMDSISAYRSDRFYGFEESFAVSDGDIDLFTQIKPLSTDVAIPDA